MVAALLFAISTAFGPAILDLSIQFDEQARQSLTRAPGEDVPATMVFRDAGREETFRVALHVKGQLGSARSLDDKPAFKIKLATDKRFLGLTHLTLNNMVQDPTLLRETLGYQVYAAAGAAVPRTGYAHLTVNGQDRGLYLNVETIDDSFLERAFGDRRGVLYEAAYGVDLRDGDEDKFELHEGRDPNHARLRSLIRALHAPGDGVFYGATAQVDTRSFLAMLAAGTLLADWDNYYAANNYRIYWSPRTRRWVFIPTGIDQTFASGSTTPFGGIGVLFQKCLASDRCVADYAAAVRDAADRFERLGLLTGMDAWLSVIDGAATADPASPHDAAMVREAREEMRRFIATQPARVRDSLSCLGTGGSEALTACAGYVIASISPEGCIDSRGRIARCRGGAKQRWRTVARGDAFELRSVDGGRCLDARRQVAECSGADLQRFTLQPSPQGQLVVAGRADDEKGTASPPWQLRRSIFH